VRVLPNQRWSLDIVHDKLCGESRFGLVQRRVTQDHPVVRAVPAFQGKGCQRLRQASSGGSRSGSSIARRSICALG